MLKNKLILVTGGTGFIGSNLVKRLVMERADVHLAVRSTSNFQRIKDILDHITVHTADLTNPHRLKELISWIKPEGVFHLGATTIMQGIMSEPEKVREVNFFGTKKLVEALEDINYNFFINTSTFTDLSSSDNYAKSKLEATNFCANYAKENKKPIITLRIFTPYGPYIQKGRLIYNVLTQAIKGEEIKMTSPNIVRDFIYVDDLVDLYFAAAEHAKENFGEIFNAASGVSTTLKEVVDTALKITGSKSKVVWSALPNVSYDTASIESNIQRTISCLNWKPKTNFSEGMQKTYDWLKDNLHLYQ